MHTLQTLTLRICCFCSDESVKHTVSPKIFFREEKEIEKVEFIYCWKTICTALSKILLS